MRAFKNCCTSCLSSWRPEWRREPEKKIHKDQEEETNLKKTHEKWIWTVWKWKIWIFSHYNHLFSHLTAYWSNKCEIFFCVFCASVVKNQFTITGSMKHESFKIKFDNITMILNSLRIKSWSDLQPRIDVISRSLRQNGWMNNQTVDCKENADLHLYCNNQMPFWSQ